MNLEQGSPEWHAFRKNHIGASDAPIIMGAVPKHWEINSPYKLWQVKLGLREVNETYAMRRGSKMEDEARKEFEMVYNTKIPPAVLVHPEYSWMSASVDGINDEYLVEIKCPGPTTCALARKGEVPMHYYIQMQHQMAVTGREMCIYRVYDESGGISVPVYRDQNYINKMIEKEKEFWDCVLELRAPELTLADYVERSDQEWADVAHEWKSVSAELKALEAKEKELRKILQELADGKSSIGCGIKLSTYQVKGRVDYAKIPELENVDLEKYRKPSSTSWRFTQYEE